MRHSYRLIKGGLAIATLASAVSLLTACTTWLAQRSPTELGTHTQQAIALPVQDRQPEYHRYETARSVIHLVRVPVGGRWQVVPRVTERLSLLPQFAGNGGGDGAAIALINAGFFDPANQLTTSAITVNGALVADPRQNSRLMGNPDLTAYLDRILNRSELRRSLCGGEVRYSIARHQDPVPPGCQQQDAIGAGPRLLPSLDLETEGFREVVNGRVVRDAIGSDRPNARSAVGITAEGDLLLVMAAQRPEAPQSSGITLPEMAQFLASQGAVEALNLDGGSSASLFFQGNTFYGRVNAEGQWVQRPVKSALAVIERSP
ncbi:MULTISPECIES: phosphodiester glycosidase family protein [unclassified Leptolyngbya]|uniref:phosphodiester glycosidase family protein n=1 Tax=unclassified Leptolyngbya TaxID=2650499 RepID=UPI0016888855|nr:MULTISPECIES: phosphodiester glycosidase family protein [unclassified Leptolyngbya]MBD1913727.1 phosphodiester glycosidase family protein [Leptolyngbya sp. FACHB-8]MBD2155684.1 phosphodiester glycosidase family protein [Leptolyngbya sp. FACHB-16]